MRVHYISPLEQALLKERLDPANDFHFDPESLFQDGPLPDDPNDRNADCGLVRGPSGGIQGWVGRGAALPTARKVLNHGGTNHLTTLVHTSRMSASMWTQASREPDLARLLDWAPAVRSFRSQPEWIRYSWRGRQHRTCPDFLVVRHSGHPMMIEVKPPNVAASAHITLRTEAVARACARMGLVYGVVSDDFIRRQPRLANIRLLSRYRETALTQHDWARLRREASGDGRTIAELESEPNLDLQRVYAALFRRLLVCDINQPITLQMRVRACR